MTPTALYLHFNDKDQLLEAVKERCFGELHEVLVRAEGTETDPRAQAEAMCLAYLRFAEEKPGSYRVCFQITKRKKRNGPRGMASPDIANPQAWPTRAVDAFDDLVRSVTRCLEADGEPTSIAIQVWAGLHGFASIRELEHVTLPQPDRFVRELLASHLSVH